MPDVSVDRLRPMAAAVRNQAQFVLGQMGFAHSGGRLTRDASQYWSGTPDDRLLNDSHCRDGSKFEDTALWTAMGQEHLQLFQRLRRTTGRACAAEENRRLGVWRRSECSLFRAAGPGIYRR